ncbi:MAG: hypothetical protein AAGK22_08950 [Acidobacteriota bacterium]
MRLIRNVDPNSLVWPLALLLGVPALATIWVVLMALLWIDQGVGLYRHYPALQVTAAAALLIAGYLVLTIARPSRGFWLFTRIATLCFAIPFSLSVLYADLAQPERRDFLLKAHSIKPGDSVDEVERLLEGYNRWVSDPPSDWVSFGMSPGRSSFVGISVYLSDDRETVAGTRFKWD